MELTAQELANLFIHIERSDDDPRQLARRMRHFEAESLILSAPEKRDARGTAQFDEVEACKARLLSILADFGFDKNLLSQVVRMVAPPASGVRIEGGKEQPFWDAEYAESHHIKNLPAAIRRGEKWELVLKFNSQFGHKTVSGGFVIPSDSSNSAHEVAAAEAASQAMRQMQSIELYGLLTLPASDLCAPVISAFDNQGSEMGFWQRILGKSEPAQTRRFDGAASGRRGWGMGTFGRINPETAAAGSALRSRASYLAINNPWIANAVGNTIGALIGAGIQPSAKHPDAATRKALNRYFAEWTARADAEGRTDFAGLQVAVANSMVVAGEAVVLLNETADGPRLRVLPSELLDESKTVELSGGRAIFSGVELDASGRRAAYWVTPEQPGKVWQTYAPSVRIEAESVLHVVKTLAPGQLRGVSWLAPVILPASDFDKLCDALLKGAQVAAMHAGFIVDMNGNGEPYDVETPSLEPGALIRLPNGTDIKFNSPQQAQQVAEFMKLNLRQLAAGLGLPDHLLSADLTGANYSSLRAGLLPFRQRMEQVQYTVLVPQFLAPVWRAVILHGILSGDLDAPDFESNPEAFLQADWLPPKPLQVDPLKDINATVAEIEAGLTSRRKAVAERGWVFEDLEEELQAERGTVAKDKESKNDRT